MPDWFLPNTSRAQDESADVQTVLGAFHLGYALYQIAITSHPNCLDANRLG